MIFASLRMCEAQIYRDARNLRQEEPRLVRTQSTWIPLTATPPELHFLTLLGRVGMFCDRCHFGMHCSCPQGVTSTRDAVCTSEQLGHLCAAVLSVPMSLCPSKGWRHLHGVNLTHSPTLTSGLVEIPRLLFVACIWGTGNNLPL